MPPGVITLSTIRLAAQRRADMENSSFVSNAEWLGLINSGIQELYDKLVEAYGSDYYLQTAATITTDGTNDKYALPTDFFKLLGVDLQLSGSSTGTTGWISLWRFNFAQRNQYTLPNIQTLWGRTNLKYRLAGSNIWFIPLPAASQTLRLWYAPRFTALVNDADTFDGINGWEEFVILSAAINARIKEESPVQELMAMLARQDERLTSIKENRDAGAPGVTVDVYRANGWSGDHDDWGY